MRIAYRLLFRSWSAGKAIPKLSPWCTIKYIAGKSDLTLFTAPSSWHRTKRFACRVFGNTVGFQRRSAFPGTAGVAGRGSALLARLWPPFLQQSDGQVSGNTQTLGQHLVVWTLGGAHSPIELLRISEMHLTPVFLIHFREDSKLPRKTCFGHNFTLTSLLHALVQ